MLSEWESELENRSKEVRMSAQGKMSSATQKQTRQFIKPLFKLFKTRTTPADVLRACERICTECLARQYSKADEAYLTMAIGNAAWPLGVTMVSIHERAGRTKLFSQQVARQSLRSRHGTVALGWRALRGAVAMHSHLSRRCKCAH
jgi:pre-mRNA-splicing factor 18